MSEIQSIKASETTRSHLNSPGSIAGVFDSMDTLNQKGEEIAERILNVTDRDYTNDVKEGLDINDIESIKNFKLGYTVLGDSLLVKFIRPDANVGKILVPDSLSSHVKAVIISVGTMVFDLQVGDIIILKGQSVKDNSPIFEKRTIKKIDFREISYFSVAGLYMDRENYFKRLKESDAARSEA